MCIVAKNDGDIVKADQAAGTIQRYSDTNPIGVLLNSVVEKGITAETASSMKEIVGLYERMEDRAAKQQFTAAMTALQAELPKVIANRFIPDNSGGVRSTFADYRGIWDIVGPFLTKHGFSVSFTIRYDAARLIAVCKMRHTAGHEETNEFGVRIGSGPPKASEAQADGAARSYARRGALCDALNIVVDHDDDARVDGAQITTDQAKSLRERAVACGADETRLLKFAGSDSYEQIRATKFAAVDEQLRKRESAPKAKAEPAKPTVKAATRVGPGGVVSAEIGPNDIPW